MLQQLTLAALIFQAAVITQTAGHGNIIVPKPTGNADHPYYFGGPAGTIDMAALVGSASYGDYYQAADEWFTKNNIASLKEYITKYGTDISECGNTEKKGPAQPVPSDGYAQHDTLGNSHPGPCEIWCDDKRVFHNTNCAGTYAGQVPTKLPIDVSTCQSSSEFVFYWLALHAQPWQVYINCVALDGTTAASSTTNSTSTSTTTTSAPVSASTETSVDGEASEEDKATETPVATQAPSAMTTAPETEAPAAATSAPATSSSKCVRRRS
ncbi:hypothetical protein ON010_g4150 [Phytophthora cinnamomi]|nr:hypothetical protein ON010_g4150 [Phytophthora cinnamomi]